MKESVEKALGRYGITIQFSNDGLPELIGGNGIRCSYSSRAFCPAVSMGAPEGAVSIRRRADGVAELMIEGRRCEYRQEDPMEGMEIPTE
jgi:hypothetical protein